VAPDTQLRREPQQAHTPAPRSACLRMALSQLPTNPLSLSICFTCLKNTLIPHLIQWSSRPASALHTVLFGMRTMILSLPATSAFPPAQRPPPILLPLHSRNLILRDAAARGRTGGRYLQFSFASPTHSTLLASWSRRYQPTPASSKSAIPTARGPTKTARARLLSFPPGPSTTAQAAKKLPALSRRCSQATALRLAEQGSILELE
jgi:hypothetical protein